MRLADRCDWLIDDEVNFESKDQVAFFRVRLAWFSFCTTCRRLPMHYVDLL